MRIYKKQGMNDFTDGNFTNCTQYFPVQALNLIFST